jgi:hypothetical protein
LRNAQDWPVYTATPTRGTDVRTVSERTRALRQEALIMFDFAPSFGRFALPLAAVAMVAGADVSLAQVQAVSPYYAMVTQDSTNLRSGPSQNFYSVLPLTNGTILVVDGETQGWNRVLYPVGAEAFVDAKDASLAENKVVLSKESQLKAINQTQGYGWSWKMLTDAPLASGTSLTLVESIKEGEIVVGYKVVAPSEARGYVPTSRLRRATQSEVDAWWAAGKALPQLPNVTIGTAETAPAPTPQSTEAAAPKTPAPVRTLGAGDTIATDTNAGSGQPANIITGDNIVADAETSTIADLSDPTPEQLERIFQRVWREPIESSEVDELIGQYEVAAQRVEANQTRRKAALEQRIEALKVRRDYRDALRRQTQAATTIQQNEQQAQQQLEMAATARVYNIVGVLQPSTIYNGERLPRMYRIVSVGGTSPRTLGYIRHSSELDLDRYIGQIIGVVGENQLDRSLQLNLINAVRIDPLRTSGLPLAAPADSGTLTATPNSVPATQPTPQPATQPSQQPGDAFTPPAETSPTSPR